MSAACQALRSVIDKHFFFLGERGFKTASERTLNPDTCVIFLEAQSLRIQFYTARDESLNILVGSPSADLDAPLGKDGENSWYYLRGIAGFIEGDLGIGERVALMSDEEWEEAHKHREVSLARLLETHIDRIQTLFSDEAIQQFRLEYDAYARAAGARTRAAYGSRSRKH